MNPDENQPYYFSYEKRYRSAYEQGADHYGLPAGEEEIRNFVRKYVSRFALAGKKVVEFGCGEGIAGLEFARLDCIYEGYDLAPSAIEKAKAMLAKYPNAKVSVCDLVAGELPGKDFDAGIDISCLHMLVTDPDRSKYLANLSRCLKSQATAYFVRAGYRENAHEGAVTTYEQWLEIYREDIHEPKPRMAQKNGKEIQIMLPLIPYRPRTEKAYRAELNLAGFEVVEFEKSEGWANILVRRR